MKILDENSYEKDCYFNFFKFPRSDHKKEIGVNLGAMMFQNKIKNQKDHYNVLVFVKKIA